jgi:hypothetical protein
MKLRQPLRHTWHGCGRQVRPSMFRASVSWLDRVVKFMDLGIAGPAGKSFDWDVGSVRGEKKDLLTSWESYDSIKFFFWQPFYLEIEHVTLQHVFCVVLDWWVISSEAALVNCIQPDWIESKLFGPIGPRPCLRPPYCGHAAHDLFPIRSCLDPLNLQCSARRSVWGRWWDPLHSVKRES